MLPELATHLTEPFDILQRKWDFMKSHGITRKMAMSKKTKEKLKISQENQKRFRQNPNAIPVLHADILHKGDQYEFDRAIAKYVVNSGAARSVVENKYFQLLLEVCFIYIMYIFFVLCTYC